MIPEMPTDFFVAMALLVCLLGAVWSCARMWRAWRRYRTRKLFVRAMLKGVMVPPKQWFRLDTLGSEEEKP